MKEIDCTFINLYSVRLLLEQSFVQLSDMTINAANVPPFTQPMLTQRNTLVRIKTVLRWGGTDSAQK